MDMLVEQLADAEDRSHRGGVAAWSFVYGFFSNGVPFDAPNRSEPCPRS